MSEITPYRNVQSSNTESNDASRVMLMLGEFVFSIETTAYKQLTREASWRWQAQERIGRQDILHYTGKSGRTVKLEGEAHAFFGNGVSSVDDLYDLGDDAAPQQLVSGQGDVLGWWVMTEFSDAVTRFLPGGVPRNKTWNISLVHYAEDISNP